MFKDNLNKFSPSLHSQRNKHKKIRVSASPAGTNQSNHCASAPSAGGNKTHCVSALSAGVNQNTLWASEPSAGGNKNLSALPQVFWNAFSLIEVVSFVVIVAISFTVLVLVFRNAGSFSMRGDLITQASQLAIHRMETIRTYSFNDIDTWDNVSTTHGSVTVTSTVYYVDPSDLETEVTGPTPLKRILVEASAPDISTVSLSSLYGVRSGVTYE